jgi:hypothetical protein
MKRIVLCIIVGLALVGTMLAQGPNVDGKFSNAGPANFGAGPINSSSRLVIGGVKPDDKSVNLTSNCGAQTYSTNCFSTAKFTWSGVTFTPNQPFPLSNLTTLSTDYNFGGADCGGGSPRFIVFTQSNNYEANLGPPPNFTNCYHGWLNTGNFTNTSDPTLRWQISNGNTYMTWQMIVTAHGSELVTEIDIVLDGGWFTQRGQEVTIDNLTVNNKVMNAEDVTHQLGQ